jgi:hypothetical protein
MSLPSKSAIEGTNNPRATRARSFSAGKLEMAAQQAFYIRGIFSRMVATNCFASYFAGQFVQAERHSEPFFTGHLPVTRDLFL